MSRGALQSWVWCLPGWRVLLTAQPECLAVRGVLVIPHEGWQRVASSFLEQLFLDFVLPWVSLDERALLCSQRGPLAALPFTAMPVSPQQLIDSDIFRVPFLRRLSLPLPLSSHSCRCGRPLDCLGHHRASCALASSAAARVCREAKVSTNVFLRDLDLVGICVQDQPHRGDSGGTAHFSRCSTGHRHHSCDLTDGVERLMEQLWRLLDAARNVLIQSWLVTVNVPSWLCLLGVGGRFSEETHTFVRFLARVKTRSIPETLRTRARKSWMFRWGSLLACAAARAFASSLLDRRGATREQTAPPRRMLKFWLISAGRH